MISRFSFYISPVQWVVYVARRKREIRRDQAPLSARIV